MDFNTKVIEKRGIVPAVVTYSLLRMIFSSQLLDKWDSDTLAGHTHYCYSTTELPYIFKVGAGGNNNTVIQIYDADQLIYEQENGRVNFSVLRGNPSVAALHEQLRQVYDEMFITLEPSCIVDAEGVPVKIYSAYVHGSRSWQPLANSSNHPFYLLDDSAGWDKCVIYCLPADPDLVHHISTNNQVRLDSQLPSGVRLVRTTAKIRNETYNLLEALAQEVEGLIICGSRDNASIYDNIEGIVVATPRVAGIQERGASKDRIYSLISMGIG